MAGMPFYASKTTCSSSSSSSNGWPGTSECLASLSVGTSQRLERRRTDRGLPASWPAQERSSAGDGSREFHLWA